MNYDEQTVGGTEGYVSLEHKRAMEQEWRRKELLAQHLGSISSGNARTVNAVPADTVTGQASNLSRRLQGLNSRLAAVSLHLFGPGYDEPSIFADDHTEPIGVQIALQTALDALERAEMQLERIQARL